MSNIVLIGAGNIGSRHLQGLALLKMPASIWVVDPFEESLLVAQKRFEEVYKGNNIKIQYIRDIKSIPNAIDIAIIATNSKIRKTVFTELVASVKIRFILFEKFLFQSKSDFEEVENILKQKNIKAWVNCPRRLYKIYGEIKELLKTENRFEFSVSGSSWGLGCNSIHYLDLIAYFSNSYRWKVDTGLLDAEIIESKRQGYIEFTGSLVMKNEHDYTGVISSYNQGNKAVNIIVNTERYSIVIIEKGIGSLLSVTDKTQELNTEVKKFDMPFQSQLTNQIVESILATGETELTSYSSSRLLHESVLDELLSFTRKYYNDQTIQACPIT